jgi:hypothetical protein
MRAEPELAREALRSFNTPRSTCSGAWAGGLCIQGCLDEVGFVTSLKRSLYIRI